MPVTFVDLAQNCAPMVSVETLAAVVSLESRLEPYSIRIGNEGPIADQPATKAGAIAVASSLAAEGKDVRLGLGGIGSAELTKLKLSIADSFDPCLNLQATGTLLDGYFRLAVRAGADLPRAERVMLQSYYGRRDPSTEAMARYDRQVAEEAQRLSGIIATLTIGEGEADPVDARIPADSESASETDSAVPDTSSANLSSWDVFNRGRASSVLVFQNHRSEQSE